MLISDAETPGGERAKVLDFGIAKLEAGTGGSVRTRTNTVMGTPVYMAPEQCRGLKTIDDRADVYALGVMLFEMLAGQPPFFAEAPGDLIAMHMFQPPPALSTFVPSCEPALNRLLVRMLAKDPQTRPSMADIVQTLKALGNLVSDVVPAGLLEDAQAQAVRSPPTPESLLQKRQHVALPAAPAAPASTPNKTDPEATVQERDAGQRPLPPSPTSDDSTEVMTAGRLPAMPGVPLPDSDATAPVMSRAAVQRQAEEYRRRRASNQPAWLVPIAQASARSARRIRVWSSSKHAALKRTWERNERRRGLLVFGGLFVVAVLLGLSILLVG